MKHTILLAASLLSATVLFAAPAVSEADIAATLGKLSLEQKARLIVGTEASTEAPSHYTPGSAAWSYAIPSLGIPGINLADGPVGPRINPMPWIVTRVVYDDNGLPHDEVVEGARPADARAQWCTAFPSTTALAATFDRDAARTQGRVMGDECAAYGVDVLLTPGINIMRNPLCGRNFEYYSEDPLLAGSLASELIQGLQEKGVGASLKHLVANNQQTGKKYDDAVMTQRALREIYLPAFERVVREAKPWTVMSSYNRIGGQYTQTNQELLKTLLRDEYGFDGLVMTDWFVYRPTAELVNARTGLIMPGREELVQEVIACVKDGSVSEAMLDTCVADVLRLAARSLSARGFKPADPDLKVNADASRRLGAEAMVLLKNNDGLLPLAPGAKISLFGTSAYMSLAGGTGSSNVNKRYVVDIDSGLIAAGYHVDPGLAKIYRDYNANQATLTDSHPHCPAWQKISYHRPVIAEMDLSHARTLIETRAAADDAAVVVVGRKSGETADRTLDGDFNITDAERTMIRQVCEAFHAKDKPVVVVLNVCGVIETASWKDMPDAILLAWFPGQECGYAVADVLSGAVDPSGRLPMTWPENYSDIPSSANYPYLGQTEGRNFDYTLYEEDIWVGYRYFDTTGRRVSYPFGYGLSYTTFGYSDAKVSRKGSITTISVTVSNTGKRAGRDVVQLYVSAPANPRYRKPAAELRGFAKTRTLQPGESQRVSISVTDRELASFDQDNSCWLADAGTYTAHLGRAVGDYYANLPFTLKKEFKQKVADIIKPARPIKPIDPQPRATDAMSWHKGADFKILGRVYPDSLPIYSRVPEFLKPTTREALYKLGQHTAGMAVRFRSDSPALALKWKSKYGNDHTHMAALATRGADLYCLTPEGTWRMVAVGRPMGDPTTWLMLSGMEPAMREYMLHLPLYDSLDELEIGISPDAAIEMPAADTPRADAKPLVIYGSSIQHGATASRPGMAASNILRRELGRDVINLGFSANAHLDYEIARMMADVDAAAYILDFMPNATVAEINDKTAAFVKILRDRRPDAALIFLEDPYTADALLEPATKAAIDAKNEALRSVYADMTASGLANTYYITADKLQTADGDGSSDGIHYTDYSFRHYADTLKPIIKDAISK